MSNHLPAVPRENQRPAWPTATSSQGSSQGFPEPSPAGAASLTYEPFYGLKEKPFSLSSDPRFLFKSPLHAPAFDRLLAGIRRREGLIVLTGEIGTGKTTLCRAVLGSLDRRTFSTFVADPFVSREDLIKMLLVDFGVMSVDDLKAGRLRDASRAELGYPLYEFLNSLVPLQAYAVLVIDEAQNLSLPLLEEIRILSDLEGREKLLQVVLVGQPELRSNLKLPEMRQVDQRVSVRCELAPIGRAEVTGYVACRLNVAGGGISGVWFTPDALDVVYRASAGTPRVINLLCDRALHEGFARRVTTIDAAIVSHALSDLDLSRAEPVSVLPAIAAATPASLPAVEATAPASVAHSTPAWATEPDSVAVEAFPLEHDIAPVAEPWLRWRWRAAAEGLRERLSPRALALIVVLAAAVGASAWYLQSAIAQSNVGVTQPALPMPPRLAVASALTGPAPEPIGSTAIESEKPIAGADAYVVKVASFGDEARAARLVSELAKAGYRASGVEVDLGHPRWRLLQVVVGGYATRADAQAALERLREIPGCTDATVRTARESTRP